LETVSAVPKFVEVAIAGRTLKLSPLSRAEAGAAARVATRLALAGGKPITDSWFGDLESLARFIFIAAQKNHPSLTFEEVYDDATFEEVDGAFAALGKFMGELSPPQRSN
jgi:hypothetical protein